MKQIVLLLMLVVASTTLYAQQKSQAINMTGTICDSKCVTQNGSQSSCDSNCTQNDGDAVFVDDNGKATKIANPEKVKGYKGKHVKAKCKMNEDQDTMRILSIYG